MNQCEAVPLPRLIYQTSLRLQGHADHLLRPYDLTLEQFQAIKTLYLEGGCVGQKNLCGLTDKTPANMTRILDRLAKKDFVERRPDSEDRRAFQVLLTKRGSDLAANIMELFADYLVQLLDGINTKEQQRCEKVLERVNQNMESIETGRL